MLTRKGAPMLPIVRKSVRRLAICALFACVVASRTPAQSAAQQPRPIIDMHIHAFGWDHSGNPPPPNVVTGTVPTARTDKQAMDATLAEMKRYNVVKAVAGGPRDQVARWVAADPGRIIGGTMMAPDQPLPDLKVLREDFRAGRLGVLGELAMQYQGMAPNDPQLEPYWALAEELDIPVGLHTGLAAPGTPYSCCPKFRTSLGNPALFEEVLVRHPKMRVYLMHAGFPYQQETIAIMHMYPQVYADVGAIVWRRPRAEFHTYLQALVRSGFGKRLMFGSDQEVWPESIGMAIEGIESASFLTPEQKRDIFYNNAVRFLRLDARAKGNP
jgi:predicted TIM-barrel fold metal-dependent hydrolase